MSFIYLAAAIGYMVAKNGTIEKVINYSCEKILDRKDYEICKITVEERLK
jgi:hypothetical protein